MHLRSVVGLIELEVWHGQDPKDRHWGCPIRERWGLQAHQQLSPRLQEKLAFTVTATSSYAQAAAVAAHWDCPVDDSTLHALTQKLGEEAEAQTQERLESLPEARAKLAAEHAVAVFMLDGWQVRQRGPDWGKKKTQKPRVAWHELKTGVFYFLDQAGQTAGGRGLLAEKVVVNWQGEPMELGRRLHWEAVRRGLGKVQ
jgi:hypothetical protein